MDEHATSIEYVPYNGGYPFRSKCACGWRSKTYAATHAAEAMGQDHLDNPVSSPYRTLVLPL
jgi:hypothetical protein